MTEKPDDSVFSQWPTQYDTCNKPITQEYFDAAEKFIGVSKIPTTAGIGNFKLARTKVFQEAAKAIQLDQTSNLYGKILNEQKTDANGNPMTDANGNPILEFDAKLSITDMPQSLFKKDGLFEPAPNGPLSPQKIVNISQDTLQKIQSLLLKYSREANVCQRQGRCVLGCIPGARHTLNKQLYGAISSGKPIDILPLCEVKSIEENNDNDSSEYKFKIEFIDYRDIKNGTTRTIKAKLVVISSGTIGSTELLLRCKKLNKLQLSDKVGKQFSTNADILGVINPTEDFVDVTRGPIVTSIAKFKDGSNGNNDFAYSIEDSGFPKMFADIFAFIFNQMTSNKTGYIPDKGFIDYLQMIFVDRILNNSNVIKILTNLLESQPLTLSTVGLEPIITALRTLITDPTRPLAAGEERVSHMLWLSGMGIDDSNGILKLDNDNKMVLDKPYKFDHKVYGDIISTMVSFSKVTGKDKENSLIVPFWGKEEKSKTQFVLHPLGGCPMGKDSTEGVVDSMGNLFKANTTNNTDKYDKLFVVDGSIIPSAIGVNPSLMISALAFRIAEHITGDKKYWPN